MTVSGLGALLVVVGVAVGSPTTAVAAPTASAASVGAVRADHTPPTLTIEPYGRYLQGSQVNTSYGRGGIQDFSARYYLKWATSDPSGICQQTVTEQSYDTQGGPTDPVLGYDTETYTIGAADRTWDYHTNFGDAMRVSPRFVVRSTDCAGNTRTSSIVTTQFGIVDDPSSSITYQGTWRTARFSGFSGGTTHYSTTSGDSFQMSGLQPGPLGLVMEAKSDRGQVDVYVDGRFRATVDTGTLTPLQHRTVVWQIILNPGSTHTVQVVNRGTAGRPRVDLDAVLTGNMI